jgi:hypothetical protein
MTDRVPHRLHARVPVGQVGVGDRGSLAPDVVGEIAITGCELVTSSDVQRRHRR